MEIGGGRGWKKEDACTRQGGEWESYKSYTGRARARWGEVRGEGSNEMLCFFHLWREIKSLLLYHLSLARAGSLYTHMLTCICRPSIHRLIDPCGGRRMGTRDTLTATPSHDLLIYREHHHRHLSFDYLYLVIYCRVEVEESPLPQSTMPMNLSLSLSLSFSSRVRDRVFCHCVCV